ncbi:RidA family protein [Maribacter sp. 2307ULW6-5]|uniref:RidA family protein n=1 Tax=Maribacter sp. 2307ULW6-5 TaxID=3386275 RepID=UPI0039BD58E5
MKNTFLLFFVLLMACKEAPQRVTPQEATGTSLLKTVVDPREGYSEAVIVEANGIKTIYISGQVGEGPTFEAQFRDALGKLLKTLENSGASFDDVVKYNTYVVDYSPDMLPVFRAVRKELLGDTDMPASTLVGVPILGLDSWKVEIEATAVLPVN